MTPISYVKKQASKMPKELCLDQTINLLMEGYLYIPNRIRKYNSSLFQTRIMGQKVICMSGKKAAQLFYDQNKFTRKGAIPNRIQQTLFGKNAIQTLDGAAHMHRKQLFMSIMDPVEVDRIVALAKTQWQINTRYWDRRKEIVLFDEASKLLFQVACKWSGVPLHSSGAMQKAQDLSAMIDAFGAVGPRHIKGRCARNRTECWVQNIIQEVRSGKLVVPSNTALYQIAWHKDLNNQLLNTMEAAIELINILRPITAIATYLTFGALALHMYPEYKKKLEEGEEDYSRKFTQEIRRFFPFGPFLGARVRSDFKLNHYNFKKNTLVFLDIYGTNHDPDIWPNPNIFDPEHFRDKGLTPFDFIPQGGGEYKTGTRCPGEILTIELTKISLEFLVKKLQYQVPLQDFSYCLNRMPTRLKSKFIIDQVQKKTVSTK